MSPSTASSQISTTAAAAVWLRMRAPMETPRAPYSAVDTTNPAATRTPVAVEVDVDAAGVQPRHGDRRRDGERQQAHQCAGERVGDELGDHDVAPAGRGEEGGGDRLVPVLAGHAEHAEQDGDEGDDGGRAADDLDQAVGSERVVALSSRRALRMAMVTRPATTGAAQMPATNVRVVRCLSSSVRTRRFMTSLLRWW